MITRISTTYGSSSWGGAFQQPQEQGHRPQLNQASIWGNSSSFGSGFSSGGYDFVGGNNGIENVNYAQPGASYIPMDQIMTAPFGANANLFGSNFNDNNIFAPNNFDSPSFYRDRNDNYSHRRMGGREHRDEYDRGRYRSGHARSGHRSEHGRNREFLSLTGKHSAHNSGHHSNNIFRNADGHSNNLKLKSTSIRTGNFGSQTMSNRSTSIHTPSVDFNTREVNAGNRNISSTNISGHIDKFKQTNQHIVTPTSDLNRIRQVVETPTERITRNVTKGTIWI